MATNPDHKKLITLLSTQKNQLDRLYARKAKEMASILKRYKLKDGRLPWKGNKKIEKEIDQLLSGLDLELKQYIKNNMLKGAELSNVANDGLVERYTKGMALNEAAKATLYARNTEAVNAFVNYRTKGLDISGRVWDTKKQTKEQMEYFLKSGLADGTSAKTLTTDLKQFLKEPNKVFRRVRDENGKLQLSKPAKAYKSGRGVYRSSYANALRLAKNEINISYRMADHIRRKDLDFVVGFRVNLSNAHPKFDICDSLVGRYPKNFVFTGWHVGCLCFTTSILMDKEEFKKGRAKGSYDQRRQVKSIPKEAKDYLNKNAATIKGYKNPPYFIKDNFKNTKDGFELRKEVSRGFGKGGATPDFNNNQYLENNIDYAKARNLDSLRLYGPDSSKTYAARQILREGIVRDYLKAGSSKTDTVHILGGATANGKSTLLESGKLKFPKNIMTVDSDAIKGKIPEYNLMLNKGDEAAAAFVHEESSTMSKSIISNAIKKKDDFILDGVNDGDFTKLQKKFETFRDGGRNRLVANYVTLDTDLSIKLAKARAQKTGREVPLDYIKEVNREVPRVVQKLINNNTVDELYLWDTNVNKKPRLILSQIDGKLTIFERELYERFKKKGK